MKPQESARQMMLRVLDLVVRHSFNASRDARNVDICLSTLCGPELLAEVRFPVAYVEFLRTCIEHMRCAINETKREPTTSASSQSFTMVLEVLRSNVPAIEFSAATIIALVADHNYALRRFSEIEERSEGLCAGTASWLEEASVGSSDDVGLNLRIASSFGRKGPVLSTIVRLGRAQRCLELGTAYGMSALFIAEAPRNDARGSHLTTVEGYKPVYALSSAMLGQRYGEMVSCHLGSAQDILPGLANAIAPIDFVFNDAGHSREDYIRDFAAVKDSLAAGAAVLLDDIRWDQDPKGKGTRCYEGWREICADSKVRRAAEIDRNLGLILLQ